MWSLVASRLHSPMKVFLFGEGTKETKEVMIYGTVKYGLKDERAAEVSSFHFIQKRVVVEVESLVWVMAKTDQCRLIGLHGLRLSWKARSGR